MTENTEALEVTIDLDEVRAIKRDTEIKVTIKDEDNANISSHTRGKTFDVVFTKLIPDEYGPGVLLNCHGPRQHMPAAVAGVEEDFTGDIIYGFHDWLIEKVELA